MEDLRKILDGIMLDIAEKVELPEDAPARIKGMQQHLRFNKKVESVLTGKDEEKQEKVYAILRETNEKLEKVLNQED